MEQTEGDDNPFFITRNVENDPYAQSDEDEDEVNDTAKSGKYIKFYCPDENRWKDEL